MKIMKEFTHFLYIGMLKFIWEDMEFQKKSEENIVTLVE